MYQCLFFRKLEIISSLHVLCSCLNSMLFLERNVDISMHAMRWNLLEKYYGCWIFVYQCLFFRKLERISSLHVLCSCLKSMLFLERNVDISMHAMRWNLLEKYYGCWIFVYQCLFFRKLERISSLHVLCSCLNSMLFLERNVDISMHAMRWNLLEKYYGCWIFVYQGLFFRKLERISSLHVLCSCLNSMLFLEGNVDISMHAMRWNLLEKYYGCWILCTNVYFLEN